MQSGWSAIELQSFPKGLRLPFPLKYRVKTKVLSTIAQGREIRSLLLKQRLTEIKQHFSFAQVRHPNEDCCTKGQGPL